MSRLIVKNLPAYLDEGRLKSHFAKRSPSITDVKIVRRHDGTSRRFGFLGFKAHEDANNAMEYFNRTFIDTSRIEVSVAKTINDRDLASKKERQQQQKSGVRDTPSKQSSTPIKADKQPKSSKGVSFDEFMQVMVPQSKRKSWKNENDSYMPAELEEVPSTQEPAASTERVSKKRRTKKDDSLDEEEGYQDPQSSVALDEGITDLEYMYKRMRKTVGQDLENEEQNSQSSDENLVGVVDSASSEDEEARKNEVEKKALAEKAQKDQDDVDAIMDSGRLFIRNVPFTATEEEIESYFAKYGVVKQSHISLDRFTKKSKGIAFVSFENPTQALAAFRASDGDTFQGRLLHVLPAITQTSVKDEKKLVKDKKKQELKENATKDFNWSTLYMNTDAVASSIASRLGIAKSDILNPQEQEGQATSPAVRLALAETSIIQETKDFLESEGINVDAFDHSKGDKRSDTVILVKNIPFGTSSEALEELFAKHGNVSRIVMPPSGTIAVVEMDLAGEAKVAFKALAYKRLGNAVLYLEKAPVGIMTGSHKTNHESRGSLPKSALLAASGAATQQQQIGDLGARQESAATLFVKNLAFSVTEERLATTFSKLNGYMFSRIQKRSVRKRDGSGEMKVSMGYGFVGFHSIDAARAAQQVMDKTMLEGHILSVAFTRRGHTEEEDEPAHADDHEKTAPTTKLIVKNLAFQATKKDVRALFSAYGKLKSVRVPRKGIAAGGTAAGVRGFGFVEFTNKKEAYNAYLSLRHSHLLGRHLVLEWDEEGSPSGQKDVHSNAAIDRLRLKASRNVSASNALDSGANRREKLHLNEEDIRQAAQQENESDNESDV